MKAYQIYDTINHVNKNNNWNYEREKYFNAFWRELTIPTCVCLILADSAETEARSQYPVVVPCQSILEQDDRNSEYTDELGR